MEPWKHLGEMILRKNLKKSQQKFPKELQDFVSVPREIPVKKFAWIFKDIGMVEKNPSDIIGRISGEIFEGCARSIHKFCMNFEITCKISLLKNP